MEVSVILLLLLLLLLLAQVIDGLFHAKAVTDNQSNIANNPRPVVDWLLQEMARDGHFVDDEMAALLLSLLRKACHLAAVLSRNKKQALDDAVDFAKSICIWPTRRQLASDAGYEVEARPGSESELGLDDRQSHYLGHRRLPLAEAEAVCFELLTAFCVGRKERQALEFLKVTVAEMNIKPTARFYEPLLFNYAIVSGEASLSDPRLMVQELYRDMVSHDVPQSDLTVSSIVLCYLKHGSADSPAAGDRVRDAIDMLEDLYNKHKVRPKLNFLILILDYALQIQDVSEARRLVRVAHGMYTPLERASLAAHDFDSYRTTVSSYCFHAGSFMCYTSMLMTMLVIMYGSPRTSWRTGAAGSPRRRCPPWAACCTAPRSRGSPRTRRRCRPTRWRGGSRSTACPSIPRRRTIIVLRVNKNERVRDVGWVAAVYVCV